MNVKRFPAVRSKTPSAFYQSGSISYWVGYAAKYVAWESHIALAWVRTHRHALLRDDVKHTVECILQLLK